LAVVLAVVLAVTRQ